MFPVFNQSPSTPRIQRSRQGTAILLLSMSLISAPASLLAQVPQKAVLKKVRGPKELWIRRRGRPTPAQPGSVLEKYNDSLLVNGNAKTYATLQFFSKANEALRLFVQTELHPESALYFFPCQLKGGAHLFGWGLAARVSSGCTRGIRVRSSELAAQSLQVPFKVGPSLVPIWIARTFPRQTSYCSVNHPNGDSWLAMTPGEPCAQILSQCAEEQTGTNCSVETMGQWWSHESELTTTIECAQDQLFSASDSGDQLQNTIQQLWDKALAKGAKGCALQIYTPHELVVVPPTPAQLKAAGHNPFLPTSIDPGVIIRTRTSNEACPEVKVMDGIAIVKSAQNPAGVPVRWGQKTKASYCEASEIESIQDIEDESRDLSIEIFDAELQGLPFCDELQVSGGQEGDRRTLQLTANRGVLDIEYDMKPIQDRLQIFHEGQELYNSGFVSHTHNVQLPFQGKSGRLEIVVTGNPEKDTTLWDYKVKCPK